MKSSAEFIALAFFFAAANYIEGDIGGTVMILRVAGWTLIGIVTLEAWPVLSYGITKSYEWSLETASRLRHRIWYAFKRKMGSG